MTVPRVASRFDTHKDSRPRPSLGILLSGRGSNLQAILHAIEQDRLQATIAVVISNRPGAPGLERARAAGLETLCFEPRAYPTRDAHDAAIVAALKARHVTLVCLAGYLRLLTPAFINAFPNAILNIHPSLLPAFPGLDAQRQALEHGVKITGATVHFVDDQLDTGPIVLQTAVAVDDHDTVETLSARILEQEHQLYPEAIRRVLEGRWRFDGRRVVFD